MKTQSAYASAWISYQLTSPKEAPAVDLFFFCPSLRLHVVGAATGTDVVEGGVEPTKSGQSPEAAAFSFVMMTWQRPVVSFARSNLEPMRRNELQPGELTKGSLPVRVVSSVMERSTIRQLRTLKYKAVIGPKLCATSNRVERTRTDLQLVQGPTQGQCQS